MNCYFLNSFLPCQPAHSFCHAVFQALEVLMTLRVRPWWAGWHHPSSYTFSGGISAMNTSLERKYITFGLPNLLYPCTEGSQTPFQTWLHTMMLPSCWTSPALYFLTKLSSVLHFSQTQFDCRQQPTSKSTLFHGKQPNFNIFTGLQLGKLSPRFLFIYFLIPCNWKWTATSLRLPRTTLKTLMQSSPALNRSIKARGPKISAYPPKQNVGWAVSLIFC